MLLINCSENSAPTDKQQDQFKSFAYEIREITIDSSCHNRSSSNLEVGTKQNYTASVLWGKLLVIQNWNVHRMLSLIFIQIPILYLQLDS